MTAGSAGDTLGAGSLLDPFAFGSTLSGPPLIDTRFQGVRPVLVRRWTGIEGDIAQPPLDHHYVTLHLGPKSLHRTGEGAVETKILAGSAYSITPTGAAYRWRTKGAIDFVHVYLAPKMLDGIVAETFGCPAGQMMLHDVLGDQHPVTETVLQAIADEAVTSAPADSVYLEQLVQTLAVCMLRRHTGTHAPVLRRYALSPRRLRCAIDFIEQSLGDAIGLSEIAERAGLSAFHFSRAFRDATGSSPHAFLNGRRVERAKRLLKETELPLTEIAQQCGFFGHTQLCRVFKRVARQTPSQFRNE